MTGERAGDDDVTPTRATMAPRARQEDRIEPASSMAPCQSATIARRRGPARHGAAVAPKPPPQGRRRRALPPRRSRPAALSGIG